MSARTFISIAAVCAMSGLVLISSAGYSRAQDMQTFLSNLNRQMAVANQNYRSGIAIYDRVPFYNKLDFKCAQGDVRACQLHQQQMNNANEYQSPGR